MPSFDVVCEVENQEVLNAVDQTEREMKVRYDFRDSKATIVWREKDHEIEIVADDDMRLNAIQEILRQKLSKRGVSLKLVDFQDQKSAGGDLIRQVVKIKQGLSDEELRQLAKLIKQSKSKVQAQIQGEQLRVSGKKRDDLQQAIQLLKSEAPDLELQYTNFRD